MPVEEIAGKVAGKAAEKAPSWIERVLLPSLNEIKGEIKAVNTRIDALDDKIDTKINALDDKIDSLRNEMLSKFETTDIKIDSLRNEMNVKFDSLENRIPVIEKMAALELKIAELEKRLAAASIIRLVFFKSEK